MIDGNEKEKKGKDAIPEERISKKQQKYVTLIFKENRKFDLRIGRDTYVFMAREPKQVPAEVLKHKDWPNASKYFIVKGV